MERRKFLKSAGFTAAAALIAPQLSGSQTNISAPVINPDSLPDQQVSVSVIDNKVFVETETLTATIDKGVLISFKSKLTSEEFIHKSDTSNFRALQLLYVNNEVIDINEEKFGTVTTRQISEQQAEIIFHSWEGDGVIFISADRATGDLLIEPSAYSARPGVMGCRWMISGLKPTLDLVVPFFQGVKLKLDDPLIHNRRWKWPYSWEAGLAILQSKEGGFWIHTQDNKFRFKALQTGIESDPFSLGFDSEAYGPIDNNLSAGGLCWRLNAFRKTWHEPAEQYRQWYWKAFNLEKEEQQRQSWIHDVKLAVSWCPGSPNILDELAKKVTPEKVIIHFPRWRSDPYDENYPNFEASESAKEFIKKGKQMGFHVMPHFNSIDIDPNHPAYRQVRDFSYRSIDKKELQGWSWHDGGNFNRPFGVPESNLGLLNHRDKKVMVKIHPGSSMWQAILGDNIRKAAQEESLKSIFIDVTLNIWNIHNCLVESKTPAEGMIELIRHIRGLGNGLVIAGEGLNEITAQAQSFGQVHLFDSFHAATEGLERTGGCDLNERLFGKLCRSFGYSRLGGRNEEEEMRMRIHMEHGAIPTITIDSADSIIKPTLVVKRILEMAAE